MALETEGKTLELSTVLRGVAAVLADTSKGFYLVGEQDGVPVGQLMVTFEWSDWRAGQYYWIQSVFVREDARRSGVYRALYAKVLEIARERGDAVGVRLYVERDNRRAQRTYEALGMERSHYDMFEIDLETR
ncbi:MAG TPA: GNAT family N-acetyltransferase [Polyangiaceae bacterium]|jgi:ribosomal protein S18 acetylase RimI-like enzyme|nr:GNAT family N-acetyltransferase [Polyangiaceae bacterium]